jgi:NADH dehydrogenase [ubiquinone] 1 alpha subcomplex assembly factor 3
VQTVTPWTDVVLIGTGATMQPIPAHIVAFLRQHQLPFEIASTVSAVSTFNVLCQEGRPVMAAVLNLNNKDDESRTEKKSFAR